MLILLASGKCWLIISRYSEWKNVGVRVYYSQTTAKATAPCHTVELITEENEIKFSYILLTSTIFVSSTSSCSLVKASPDAGFYTQYTINNINPHNFIYLFIYYENPTIIHNKKLSYRLETGRQQRISL